MKIGKEEEMEPRERKTKTKEWKRRNSLISSFHAYDIPSHLIRHYFTFIV
jgi:hypothetical protein